jgi:preprotein translocase subunit SecE
MNVSESAKDFAQKAKERFRSGIEFLRDVRKELNNVSWPTRHELTSTTLVVIVAVFFFGFYLYVVDLIVSRGMTYLFKVSP